MPGYEWLGDEEKSSVLDVMERGVLFRYEMADLRQGAWRVKEFEEAFAAFTGASHALAVTSGTAALKVALAALGVGYGDEVITQGFTFVATWEAILDLGAVPVFTEVDETLCMDPADLEARITPKTKAIIPVHMMGAQARIEEIMAIARAHKLPVLEDTAQSAGGFYKGRHLGTFGAAGTFSFDAVKTLTTGEGGMMITSDAGLYTSASEYHDHGHDHRPVGRGNEGRRFMGFNYRMMELQGALGLAQLAKLPRMVATQRSNKLALKEAVSRVPGVSFRVLPDEAGDSATFLTWFMDSADAAARLAKALGEEGAGPVAWGPNTWHSYHNWEHLHANALLSPQAPENRREYAPDALPRTKELLMRTLSYQIMLGWDDHKLQTLTQAINRAGSRF
ncbi:MAG: DegT/DnrJ/EryC1/StrS family aminotransferase [Deltaproteobacteria bacterium]|nr:DegT/DnrJ/EryC1/StrS family aminotransferase [Deltaproteobacteria bacterium]MCB2186336.1 DegT/DnrJ/EryC1/StrS family aminotransferase [Deltaproteobacteria bacterium]